MTAPLSTASITRRFWMLVCCVGLLTVLAGGAAAYFSAVPYLDRSHSKEMTSNAERAAFQLDGMLRDVRGHLQLIAVKDGTLATLDDSGQDLDALRRAELQTFRPEGLVALALVDTIGEARAWLPLETGLGTEHPELEEVWFQTLTLQLEAHFGSPARQPRDPILYSMTAEQMRFLIGVPILGEGIRPLGYVLGHVVLPTPLISLDWDTVAFSSPDGQNQTVVVSTLDAEPAPNRQSRQASRHDHSHGDHAPTEEKLDPDTQTTTQENIQPPHAGHDHSGKESTATLSAFALDIAFDHRHLETVVAKQQLLLSVIAANAVALSLPFVVLAWLGHRTLLAPQLALSIKNKKLDEMAAVVEAVGEGILVGDREGGTSWINPAFARMSGYTLEDMRGKNPGAVMHREHMPDNLFEDIRKAFRERQVYQKEIRSFRKDDSLFWTRVSISGLWDRTGHRLGYVALMNDVTELFEKRQALERANAEIEHQSLHDPLTGLPNGRALSNAMKQRQKDEGATDLTLVRIDLDHFKYVNDTLGHAAGDFVLCTVADILRQVSGASDLPVRIGGDEFVLMLGAECGSSDAEIVAEHLRQLIARPMEFEGKIAQVGVSFGIASTKDRLVPVDEIIVAADAALYDAKAAGRNCVRLYDAKLHEVVVKRRDTAARLRVAIEQREFVPFYQPQVDARTGEVSGVEVLCRWPDDEGQLILPGDFLPVADQLNVTGDIDAIIFQKAVDEITNLGDRGVSVPRVSFNITAQRLQDPHLIQMAREAAASASVSIAFELLESLMVDEQGATFAYHIDMLREAGIELQLDDFGASQASIVGLMHAMPDCIKIDQQLVLPIITSPSVAALVSSIRDIARALDIDVIAEGVETEEHARVLDDLGIHIQQGYHYSRPVPYEDLLELLAQPNTTRSIA